MCVEPAGTQPTAQRADAAVARCHSCVLFEKGAVWMMGLLPAADYPPRATDR